MVPRPASLESGRFEGTPGTPGAGKYSTVVPYSHLACHPYTPQPSPPDCLLIPQLLQKPRPKEERGRRLQSHLYDRRRLSFRGPLRPGTPYMRLLEPSLLFRIRGPTRTSNSRHFPSRCVSAGIKPAEEANRLAYCPSAPNYAR